MHPTDNNRPLRFALVGTGGIAQTHLQAFPGVGNASLAAVVDTRRDAAEAVAASHSCQAFETVEQMLQSTRIDAAIVSTPPSTHPEICMRLARAGVHVLCEKPLAVDRNAATPMIEMAQRCGTILTMASKFRYVSDMIYTRQLITSGVLGEILLFENTFAGHVDMSRRWNSEPAISGGGVLIDNGTHSVDIIRYLLGPIRWIQAVEARRIQGLGVEDTLRLLAKTTGGTLAAVDLSWSINKQTPWYVSVYGTAGTALVGWGESKYKRNVDREWTVFGSGYQKIQAFTDQLKNFCNAILGTERLLISYEDAIASVEVIDHAYESLRNDHWVSIPTVDETVDA
ncbi:MAG TPA: gfo/Idh/MocA family oxidoreductase [Planctomycetaceae bacterium]|nr:gfo/Idh/MocA family oxidoreductase [Planctomycetaceae bacterium]